MHMNAKYITPIFVSVQNVFETMIQCINRMLCHFSQALTGQYWLRIYIYCGFNEMKIFGN